jgi:hypothetical protein
MIVVFGHIFRQAVHGTDEILEDFTPGRRFLFGGNSFLNARCRALRRARRPVEHNHAFFDLSSKTQRATPFRYGLLR